MTTIALCLLLFSVVALVGSEYVKVRFDDTPSRPVTNPAEPSAASSRSYQKSRNVFCRAIGGATGALIAHRLTVSGSVSDGEQLLGHSLLDLSNFVNLLSLSLTSRLSAPVQCMNNVLKASAIEMCNSIMCGTEGEDITREQSLAIALSRYGVLGAVPSLPPYRHQLIYTRNCQKKLYNLRLTNTIDFHRNPEYHVYTMIHGLDEEVIELWHILLAANAKPIDNLPVQPFEHQDYMRAAIHGTVIATHLIQSLIRTARVTTVHMYGSYDATKLISRAACQLIHAMNMDPPQMAYRTHNIALKMTLYWIINNRELAETLSARDMTLASLNNLGLGAHFPTPRLRTNNSIVRPVGKFLTFNGMSYSIDAAAAILTHSTTSQELQAEISWLLVDDGVSVSDEVIAMEVLPVPGTAVSIQHTPDMLNQHTDDVGVLPNPSDWFATDAPARNATHNANVVVMGTLAVVIGTHASRVIPQLGLVTRHDQPGYRNMTPVSIYTIIQKIIQLLISKLMTIVPMSLDSGFYMLNAAFKSAKLSLNMLQFHKATPQMMIPLALKHYDLLQFHPQLQHIKWELWPTPPTLQVLHLWARPNLDVNLTQALDKKINKVTHEHFPAILDDIIAIMQHHMPGLSYYNLKKLSEDTSSKLFKWDPANAMAFLYDPETADGVSSGNFALIDAPHTPIECPGHIFCPPHPCKKSDCGFYVCDSQNPWCYYPQGIQCPGSISCPVFIQNDERIISCPGDEDCPISDVECPGRSECPDEVTVCPGSAACPLSIKCPGTLCPNRFTSRPQILLPCPLHPSCSRPSANQISCTDDRSCEAHTQSHVATVIQTTGEKLAEILKNRQPVININNTAIAHVSSNTAQASAANNMSVN